MIPTADAGERIGEVLARAIPEARRFGPVTWRVPRSGRSALELALDGDWISIQEPWKTLDSADELWDTLASGNDQSIARRPALGEGGLEIDRRADLFVDLAAWDDTKLDGRIRRVLSDFEPGAAADVHAYERTDIRNLCSDAGVKFDERDDTRVAVTISTRTGNRTATMEVFPGGFHVALELAAHDGTSVSASSRQAVASLLLTTSNLLRVVRAVVREAPGRTDIAVEANLPADADAPELTLALGALATAYEFTSSEIKALADNRIAGVYLAARSLKYVNPQHQKESRTCHKQ